MTFKKGQSGNPKGKIKGTVSAKTILWNRLKTYMTEAGAVKFKKELMKLNGEDFITKYLQALEYFKPKQARTEHDLGDEFKKALGTIYYPSKNKDKSNTPK